MDVLVAYGSGSEESDNGGEQQQKKKQASREDGGISKGIPVPETSTTMDLPPSSRVPLPLELNCEIFKCLKPKVQRKFIWGLGRDIYGMFRQKLLKKTKRVRNPRGNRLNGNGLSPTVTISADGLSVTNEVIRETNIVAEQAFPISGPQCRMDDFPGTICYYYEVNGDMTSVGLSHGGAIPDKVWWTGHYPNWYYLPTLPGVLYLGQYWIGGESHYFELLEGANRPRQKNDDGTDVFGCGLVLDPEDKVAIFFTLNGNLLGRKISISPTVDRLFPTIRVDECYTEINFGDDTDKPFQYDIKNCPGLGLDCI